MNLGYGYSDKLKSILKKLFKKDKRRYKIIIKKMEQIVQLSESEIEHFKNLQHDLSDRKRVHIDKSSYSHSNTTAKRNSSCSSTSTTTTTSTKNKPFPVSAQTERFGKRFK